MKTKIAALLLAAMTLTACGDAGEAAFQEVWDSGTEKERGIVCAIYLDDAAVVDSIMTAGGLPAEVDRSDVVTVLEGECA